MKLVLLLAAGFCFAGSAAGMVVGFKLAENASYEPALVGQTYFPAEVPVQDNAMVGKAVDGPSAQASSGAVEPLASLDMESKTTGVVQSVGSGSMDVMISGLGTDKPVRFIINENTALFKLLPKTGDEIRKESGQKDPEPGTISPPPAISEPFKKIAMQLSDFTKYDIVEIIVKEPFVEGKDIMAYSVTWLVNEKTGFGFPQQKPPPTPQPPSRP